MTNKPGIVKTQTDSSSETSVQALERFVVENEDLVELEQRVGRFNIFDALRVTRQEIRHSNFLAWLLDPAESHGQGSLFLSAVLMDLLRQSPRSKRPLNPIDLDGVELAGVEILREWQNIDLLISCKIPAFVIAIENKVNASESGEQLNRYWRTLNQQLPDTPALCVFLTPDGDEATDDRWMPYTYGDIHQVLTHVRQTNRQSIGEDVLVFLDHYLRLIGSRFMDDPRIDELCQRIYQNHRQALDLIFERIGSGKATIAKHIEETIKHDPRWVITHSGTGSIAFLPVDWDKWLPRISRKKNKPGHLWFQFIFRIQNKKRRIRFALLIGPTTDDELRRRVIYRLAKDPSEFGIETFFKKVENVGSRTANLATDDIFQWEGDDGPEEEELAEAVKTKLEEIDEKFDSVPDALRPIIESTDAPGADTE